MRTPRPRPWPPRNINVRRPGLCPVCRSALAAEYESRVAVALESGRNPRPILRSIAADLGVRTVLIERHFAFHVDHNPPRSIIGEWATGGIEYVETPAGWISSSRLMAAIRANPEAELLLAAIRGGRRQTLLNKGYFRDEKSRRIGHALLQIDAQLRFPQFVL